MVYIRQKTVKGTKYLYLVKSVWDAQGKTAHQITIKYLGKRSKFAISQIPPQYRDHKSVLRFVSDLDTHERDVRMRRMLYNKLVCGDAGGIMAAYYETLEQTGNSAVFFDWMLRPVLYDIGEMWAGGIMDIATEHIASNTAQSVIRAIRAKCDRQDDGHRVLLCQPVGEEHSIGCGIMEAYLTQRGFVVYNMGSPVPADDLVMFARQNRPDIVMISVSLEDNIKAAGRLADRITASLPVPVVMGGRAFRDGSTSDYTVIQSAMLPDILQNIRRIIVGASCTLSSHSTGRGCTHKN